METLQQKAKQYHRNKNILFLINIILVNLFLIALLVSGVSKMLQMRAEGLTSNIFLQNGLYLLQLFLLSYILFFPLGFYESYMLEHKYNLSNQTIGRWFKEDLKKNGVSLVIMLILIEALYLFLRRYEQNWWIWACCFWIIFTIIMGRIAPVIIIPLFYKHSPLVDETLKNRIIGLAERTNTEVRDIFRIDMSRNTKKANACLTGLGKSRRILLGDTLLEKFDADEIESVLAHELGHNKLRHIWKLLVIGSIFSLMGFYLADFFLKRNILFFGFEKIYEIASLPLFVLILFILSIIIMPVQNTYSRKLEREADEFALKNIENKSAFISTMEKLAEQNLSDTTPNRFIEAILYDHPSISKRIARAKQWI